MYDNFERDKIYNYINPKEEGTDKDNLWTLDKQFQLKEERFKRTTLFPYGHNLSSIDYLDCTQ